MKTPEGKTVILTFHSRPLGDLKARWKTTVTFPGGSDGDSDALIMAVDGEGNAVVRGEFEFAGERIVLKDGKGTVKCSRFVAGKHEPGVWMYRPGIVPVPGMLTFE